MVIVSGIVLLFLTVLAASLSTLRPEPESLSPNELRRRQQRGDEAATSAARRQQYLHDTTSLLDATEKLLIVAIVVICVAQFGFLGGLALAILIVLLYGGLSRSDALHSVAQPLYNRYESKVGEFTVSAGSLMRLIRLRPSPTVSTRLASRAELEELVVRSEGVLSADQKKLIIHSLDFTTRIAAEVMTPRIAISSVERTELLGPLVLSDLHKSGHSRFPVVNGDLNHIVGVLHVHDLLTINSGKGTATAAEAMEPRVFYIHADQTLQHALAAFIKTHHHLFIVVNDNRETVGLLCLEDVLEALLGHKIIDEFDAHENVDMVAARRSRDFNRPPGRTDV